MIIKVHRGQNQIGGSIIEIASETTRIILDVGVNLDEIETVNIPEVEGLFHGNPCYDAILISHYHSDHIGLLNYVLKGIPIYMGYQAFAIVKAAGGYLNRKVNYSPILFDGDDKITIGNFIITPYKCDHSAFDSYMFTISDGNKTILYTGDFRANGRMDYCSLLDKLPSVDALIIEGTTLSRETYKDNIAENELEDIALSAIGKYSGPAFIMTSAMNIERMVTAYNIAHKSQRLFLEDTYSAEILDSVGFNKGDMLDIRVFMTGGDKQYEILQKHSSRKIGKKAIAKSDFLMCIRPSMKNYLQKLNEIVSFENGILFYSMWKGYQEKDDMKEFLDYMNSLGVKVHVLHTSGHADTNTIDRLVERVAPKLIIPVHTENPTWYEKYGIPYEYQNNTIIV